MRLALALIVLLLASLPAAAQQDGPPLLDIAVSDENGPYLVSRDRPVYAFLTQGVRGGDGQPPLVSCKERCLTDWPLVTVPDREVPVAESLSERLVAVLEWEGKLVLHYNSYPLFYYAGDAPGGPPNGHAIHTYGGWWALVDANGEPISSGIVPEPDREADG